MAVPPPLPPVELPDVPPVGPVPPVALPAVPPVGVVPPVAVVPPVDAPALPPVDEPLLPAVAPLPAPPSSPSRSPVAPSPLQATKESPDTRMNEEQKRDDLMRVGLRGSKRALGMYGISRNPQMGPASGPPGVRKAAFFSRISAGRGARGSSSGACRRRTRARTRCGRSGAGRRRAARRRR